MIYRNIEFSTDKPKVITNDTFQNCIMTEQNFYKSFISNCVFENCDLSESNFSKSVIQNCKFINCNMQFSSMLKVTIINSEFSECDLWHSNLCHSKIHETVFSKCILRALFKDLDWLYNVYDEETIIDSCGGSHCYISKDMIYELISRSKELVEIKSSK